MATATTPPRSQTRQATPTSTPKTTRPPGSTPIFKGHPGIRKEGKWDEVKGVWYVEIVWGEQNETWLRERGDKRGAKLWTLERPAPEPHHPEVNPAADSHAVDVRETGDGSDAVREEGGSEAVDEASRGDTLVPDIGALRIDGALPEKAPEKKAADDAPAQEDVDDVVAPLSSIPAEWSGLERFSIYELQVQCQELGFPWAFDSRVYDELTRKDVIERIVKKVDIVAALTRRLQSDDLEHLQNLQAPTTSDGALDIQVDQSSPEYLLAARISRLSDDQRAKLLPIVKTLVESYEDGDLLRKKLEASELEKKDLRNENEHVRNENEELRNEIEGLRNKLNDWRRVKGGKIPKGGDFMSRADYRKVLENAGLLEPPPSGVAADGQDVYHIIATANGGPDHTDNYLYALGANFNRGISHNYDTFNLFMAGRAKARKAVAIALRVAKDTRLHPRIDQRRGCKQRTIFTESVHWDKFGSKKPNNSDDLADDMYNAGAGYLRFLRRVRRHQDLNDETLNNVKDMQRVLEQLGVKNVSDDDLINMLMNDGDVGDES